ncbi:MAG: CPBP family intramembrane metalloprotease [Planctomycetes bacterium]|nr:CPBP family intramembrane metalloprotease [Planctomycetota bacterium]
MNSKTDPRPEPDDPSADVSYWATAKRPLQILVFLLPLIIAYELCLALLLPAADGRSVNTVLAHKSLLQFFSAFGVADAGGLFLGGIVIVVVMLAWHVLAREAWRVDVRVAGFMALESLVLALPLIGLSHLVAAGAGAAPLAATGAVPAFAEFDVWSQMAISVGAGLYEELIFRMILIAVIHTLLVDLAKMTHLTGAAIAIAISAAAFTWYHDLLGPDGTVSGRRVLFYFLAGVYFGLVYVVRGFGLVVAVHAVYDIITVVAGALADGSD